jgi:hypothetical protein
LVKHGVDVNQRVIDDFSLSGENRNRSETKSGRQKRTSQFFRRNDTSTKPISLKNATPESIVEFSFYF